MEHIREHEEDGETLVGSEELQDASRFPVWGSFLPRQRKRGGTSLEGGLQIP